MELLLFSYWRLCTVYSCICHKNEHQDPNIFNNNRPKIAPIFNMNMWLTIVRILHY